ncbi:hypothetical protein IAQ61_002927 [Plenodomus lingam]|uniref:uncharacterized protein n=1 Tax=Leptosphaeria maculans TaxID=5022 RepID=UPI003320FA2C|nr:hypothetical protein IAQ61_002927 [Plenodomus lingam]
MLLYSTLACLDSARRCWSLESGLLIMSEAPSDAAVRLVAVLEVRLGLGRDLAWWVGGVSLFVVEMLRYGAVSAVCRTAFSIPNPPIHSTYLLFHPISSHHPTYNPPQISLNAIPQTFHQRYTLTPIHAHLGPLPPNPPLTQPSTPSPGPSSSPAHDEQPSVTTIPHVVSTAASSSSHGMAWHGQRLGMSCRYCTAGPAYPYGTPHLPTVLISTPPPPPPPTATPRPAHLHPILPPSPQRR